jgi:hypothetical protein
MIAFRLRGEIGGAATSPASDVQVGRVAVAQAPQFVLGPPLLLPFIGIVFCLGNLVMQSAASRNVISFRPF